MTRATASAPQSYAGHPPTAPPRLQTRAPPLLLESLPAIPATGYQYVLLHVGPITVTHRSLNLAITASSLTFSALQVPGPGQQGAGGNRVMGPLRATGNRPAGTAGRWPAGCMAS